MSQQSENKLPSMEGSEFDNLCSHYKNTYDIHLSSIRQRDRLFYILLIILSLFTLQTIFSDTVNGNFGKILENKWGIHVDQTYLFSTFLWFLIFGVSLQYYQSVARIEREYGYIQALEKLINNSNYYGTVVFTREGENYLKDNSFFGNWVWILYTVGFPSLLLFCIFFRAYIDFYLEHISVGVFINLIVFIFTTISTITYMIKSFKDPIIYIYDTMKKYYKKFRKPNRK